MNTNRYMFAAAAIGIGIIFFLPAAGFAQNDAMSILNERLGEEMQKINTWKTQAKVLMFLTIIVGILGAVIGAMHYVTNKWAKTATSVAGICVSVITVVINTVFTADYRTYGKVVADAQQVVSEIRLQLVQIDEITDPQQRRSLIEDIISNRFKRMTDISKILLTVQAAPPSFIAEACAAERMPEWVNNPPQDGRALYFIGTGKAATLRAAETASLDDAKGKARKKIADALRAGQKDKKAQPDQKIVDSVLGVSERANKFFQVQKKPQKAYTSYTLLKIDLELAKLNVKVLPPQTKAAMPDGFLDSLQAKRK